MWSFRTLTSRSTKSLFQAATYNDHKLKIKYIHSEKLNEANADELLSGMDGIIIAPGFGQRGIEGKFVALKWCRTHDVPTFGICLGMQCMVIEFARNVLGYADANSTEMDPQTPAQCYRPDGGAEKHLQHGRHDAPGRV